MSQNRNLTTAPRWISAPAPISVDLAHELALSANSVIQRGGGPVFLDPSRAPLRDVRRALAARRDLLDEALRFRDRKTVAEEVAALLAMFPSRTGDGEAELVVAGYVKVLDDVPAWAVKQACDRWARGRGDTAKWAPTPAELHRMAEEIAAPLRRQRTQIDTVLRARVESAQAPDPTDEQRDAGVARARALIEELTITSRSLDMQEATRRRRLRGEAEPECQPEPYDPDDPLKGALPPAQPSAQLVALVKRQNAERGYSPQRGGSVDADGV